jgi:hypothetical protein
MFTPSKDRSFLPWIQCEIQKMRGFERHTRANSNFDLVKECTLPVAAVAIFHDHYDAGQVCYN